jgi:WD40 repeat protein
MKLRTQFCLATLSLVFVQLFTMSAAARADELEQLGVRTIAFSPDGQLLAAGTGEPKQNGTVTVWDVAARRQRFAHREKTGVPGVAFSPDSKLLAIASYDNVARLLDATTGEVKASLRHPKEVRAVVFSPDGRSLATACWDQALRLWDVASGNETLTITGHGDRVFSVAFSPDGKRLASAGGNTGVKLWDCATGAEQHSLPHGRGVLARSVLFSPDGRTVMSGGTDGRVRIWDADSGSQKARFIGIGGIDGLAYSPALHTLAVCTNGPDVYLFDLTFAKLTGKEREQFNALIAKLDDDAYEVRVAVSAQLEKMGFLIEPELHRLSKESSSIEVRIRTRRAREALLSQPRSVLKGHTNGLESACFTSDGKLIATGGKDGTVRLWDVSAGKVLEILTPSK